MFVSAAVGLSRVIPVAPKRDDILGTWLGFSSELRDFCRIVLKSQGGIIAHSSDSGEEPKLYRIDKWAVDSRSQVTMRTSPISSNAYPIIIEGRATFSSLEVRIMGPEGGWRKEVALRKEALVRGRISSLEQSMQKLE